MLRTLASTWSSCVEVPIMRAYLGMCSSLGFKIYGADMKDAYAHSPAPSVPTYLSIDDQYSDWYLKRKNRKVDKRKVLRVRHCL